MAFLKVILIVAITMALSITLTMKGINQGEEEAKAAFVHHDSPSQEKPLMDEENNIVIMPSKRVSRFLQGQNQIKNPRAADHCHKDHEICFLVDAKNSTCCNNKCVDLGYDGHNCGACKKKCKYTETCCRGECVDLAYDKRHCGECNHRCGLGEYCIYGMCDYA